jgi:hypothetical protein
MSFRQFRNSATAKVNINEYNKIKVEQVENFEGEIMYSIYINEKCIHSESNSEPKVFNNVIVYASDPWYVPAKGKIRKYSLKTPILN